jgi:hypothetical protein
MYTIGEAHTDPPIGLAWTVPPYRVAGEMAAPSG